MCDAGSSPTRTVATPTWSSCATDAATSSRTLAASAFPSMSVAAIARPYSLRSMRLPRKNDAASIEARRQALGLDGQVDLSAYASAAETVTGLVEIPVSVASLSIALAQYALSTDGEVVETGRELEDVVVP